MDDKETYLLLVLSDSNLPTGSFVASAGLESTATHALFHATPPTTGSAATGTGTSTGTGTGTVSPTSSILTFLRNSINTYARSALPFARDAHRITTAYTNANVNGDIAQQPDLDGALDALARIDALYDACTLNHVARRASCAQGVALLTLYARGFTCPPFLAAGTAAAAATTTPGELELEREGRAGALVAALKVRVRRGGESDDGALGHLPVCWGVLAGALGLSVGEQLSLSLFAPPSAWLTTSVIHTRISPPDRGAHLHLFLHARGVLSAAVRMNILGPYAAQQLLLHGVKPLLDEALSSTAHLVSGALREREEEIHPELGAEQLPATTWPLGEILSARHDLLHSRIFNS